MPVSQDDLRRALSRFATGVTVITLKNGHEIHGLTVNSFTSVSLDPPLILICIQKTVSSHAYFSDGGGFVVNLLCKKQEDLSNRFANSDLSGRERFEGVTYKETDAGIPILEGNLGHLECRVASRIEAGDHTIFIGEVVRAETTAETHPLLFFESRYLDT
ncbi:flavin reductase family protein [bacterium]|nr:flavin reductase family protein [bacterium]